MKKTMILLLLIIPILVFGACNNTVNTEKPKGVKETITLPLEITKSDIDINGNGEIETIKVLLLEGQKTEGDKYKGKFGIFLYDKAENQIDQMNVNKIDGQSVELPKGFDVVFKDYNGDKILDFNIGYPNAKDKKKYTYHFYTLSKEHSLKELNILGGTTLQSYEIGYSYNFRTITRDTFATYDYDGEQYIYQQYRWQDDKFMVVNEMHSFVDYKDIDKGSIEEQISQIASSIKSVSEKDILRTSKESYNWLLNHSEEVKIYSFLNNGNGDIQSEIVGLINRKIDKLDEINKQFNIFAIDDIENYSLEEIKNFKSPIGEGDYKYKEYDWKVGEKDYKLLAGGFHLDSFILLFNQSGKFLDGYIWTDKIRREVEIEFREKQNYVSVSPIRMAYGTGISIFGGEWFEVYKDKLVSHFAYPIKGYMSPPYTIGYGQKYELIDENYNRDTGDYETSYKLGLTLLGTEKWIGIEKTIDYQWNQNEEKFQSIDGEINDIYSIKDNLLFNKGVEDEVLNRNIEEIEKIIDKEEYEGKSDDMGELTVFLMKCSQSQNRDALLKKLYNWYTENEELRNREGLIDMIEEEISHV